MSKNLPALVVAGIAITQDAEGRFSLNDLHKAAVASGANKRTTEPGKFLASPQTQGLIRELEKQTTQNPGSSPVSTIEGRSGGSSVVKELVYRYAMGISPAFELKVIRAYDALATGSLEGLDHFPPAIASHVGGIIKAIVCKQVPEAIREAMHVVLPQMVHGYLAGGQTTVRSGVTSGQVWNKHKLETLRGGPQMLSTLLCAAGCCIDGGGRGALGNSRAKLFDPDQADKAMNDGLRAYCLRYIAERKGQGPLFPTAASQETPSN